MFKSGYIQIVGETNAGKSTIFNRIVGEKVSIVSPKVQTTRKNIRGIYTDEKMQAIFIDTPGIHKVESKLSRVMIDSSLETLSDVDIVIYAIAANKKKLSVFDENIIEKITKSKKPIICIITKIDRVKKEIIEEKIIMLEDLGFENIIATSSYTNTGIEELKETIYELLPEGPKYYNEEEYTDQTTREMCEEIIRSKALKFLNEEIPHGIYIEIKNFKESKTKNGEDIVNIEAVIYTRKESHKGIIIGKNGKMLKKIGSTARQDLEEFLGCKVNLQTWVKTRKSWTNTDNIISRFKS